MVYAPALTAGAAATDIVLTNAGSPEDGMNLTECPTGTSVAPRFVPHVFPEASLTVSLADADLPCWRSRPASPSFPKKFAQAPPVAGDGPGGP
jgi:hypothetical protein